MKLIRAFIALLIVLTASACGDGSNSSSAQKADTTKQSGAKGFPRVSTIWPELAIPTCWSMDTATFNKYASQRETTRLAVTSTWEANSLVRFVGWQQCTGVPNQGVSIAVQDVGPYSAALGSQARNLSPGVVLNFEFANWSQSCQTQKDYCIRVIAVHEFGHILSFAHEQNRPDTPAGVCSANEQPQGTNGDTLFGAWDLNSVMNYCNPNWNGNGNLSPTDIAMVQAYYGDPNLPPVDITPITSMLLSD
ncbi:hypothetical protein BCF11_2114 [Collimonas sp. PA-H2]|uniref:ATPase n=1 Tax=Collimonas sp. PA-H2 TaxID=1881062 RepID=UPI000C00BDC4|nr:ATPase [Collimonas sp. PA-H2]PFH09714.1 hypothetical protein BCF11_2114 [Collimonas sp. PA-H2]